MLSYREALDRVLEHVPRTVPETVDLEACVGRVLADEVVSPFDVPLFTNSAVDGYALSAPDLDHATGLEILGTVAAGDEPRYALTKGQAARVMTGAPVPEGTAAVVMQEETSVNGETLNVAAALTLGRNVRVKGSEIAAGRCVLTAGTVVTPPVVALLAGLGAGTVLVHGRPRVGVLVTGDELALPGKALGVACIYESNSFGLAASMASVGIVPKVVRCRDDQVAVSDALNSLFDECEVVLTCGGASVGLYDFVKPALCSIGFQMVVDRVAVKPGKPFSFAVREDGKAAFCLPGNPMSALVTYVLFVWPVIGPPDATGLRAFWPLDGSFANGSDRTEFVPARLELTGGQTRLRLRPTVGSHALAGLAGANALAEIPPGTSIGDGAPVSAILLPWGRL